MKNLKFLGVLLILLVLTNSCLKTDECGECFTPPPQLFIKILSAETGENLLSNFTYTSENISLYYFDNNDKVFLRLQYFEIDGEFIISSDEMSWLAISESGETFYLKLNEETTETIHLKVSSVFENCCTYHQIDELLVNGKDAEFETYTSYIIIRK